MNLCTAEQAAELGHSRNRLADCLDAVGTQPPVFDVVEDSGETPLADQLFEGFSFCFIDDGADGVGAQVDHSVAHSAASFQLI